MKKTIFGLLLASLLAFQMEAMDASISYAAFYSTDQAYVEVYLHITGSTVSFAAVSDSTFQSSMEVLILFKKGEEIVKFDKYILSSPITKGPLDFIDQKRYGLENGAYELIVKVKDLNDPDNLKDYKTSLVIDYQAEQLQQSDIQLLSSFHKQQQKDPFVKNGIHLEPLPYNFYGKNTSSLSFYNEIYQADKMIGEDFVVSYSIEKLVNEKEQVVLIGHKRLKADSPVIPLLLQMDITELESGNYYLKVAVRNRTKELLSSKKVFFQRSNPYLKKEMADLSLSDLAGEFASKLTPEQLEYSLRSLTPKIPPRDVEMVNNFIKNDSVRLQRLYLFSYWINENPTNPEYAFRKYMEVVAAVENEFQSGFRYGFETDRGYIYLKYGQPDDMERRENEPSAPPYEVWSYNDFPITRQSNVKFIFYNPSLAPGDFVLLHSTALGEINNPQWQRELYRDAPNEIEGNYIDGTGVQDNLGRNGSRVFRDY